MRLNIKHSWKRTYLLNYICKTTYFLYQVNNVTKKSIKQYNEFHEVITQKGSYIDEAMGKLFGNKIANKITKVSLIVPKNSLETVTNEPENILLDLEISKERYISPAKRQQIIDDMR